MKALKYSFVLILTVLVATTGCNYEEQFDPNNPSLAAVESNASKATLQGLVTGLEARHRAYYTNATQMFGSFGREVWAFFGSDPRFINDWLGISGTTYPDFFASNGTYLSPYQAVLQANTLINSSANENNGNLSQEESNAYAGFAETVKAYQLIWPWLQQWDNGIRVNVEDPLDPGPILSRSEALTEIRAILDQGNSDLGNAGSELPFELTSGWSGFDSPAGLQQINRAIAARFAVYAEDYSGALTALNGSFMDLGGSLNLGPQHVYGNAPDVNNPLFYPLDASTSTILVIHPSVVEANIALYDTTATGEFNDLRARNKFYQRAEPASNATIGAEFPGEYQDLRWPSNIDPIPFIRNEELILIYAEANWFTNNKAEAISALNIIRNAAGIGETAVTTGSSDTEFIDELLNQRWFSLWAEAGHRWVDLRRFDRLDEDHVDLREGGSIFTQVAQRNGEIIWERDN